MTGRILVGDSLGSESDGVVRAAQTFARGLDAELHLVHAFEPPSTMGPPGETAVFQCELEEKLTAELDRLLAGQARRLGLVAAAGARVERQIGTPHRVLEEAAHAEPPGLLVVGSAVDGIGVWRFLGSTADRLVRRVACPVLVVAPAKTWPPQRVLYATDLSELSAGAMRCAAALLRAAGIRPEWQEALFVLDRIDAGSLTQFSAEQMTEFAAERLKHFVAEHGRDLGSGVHRRVALGSPRDALLERIAEARPDLVVLGTHGRRGLDRLLLGSVASAVLKGSAASALIVPPEAATHAFEEKKGSADWAYASDWA